jgi:hypothetical protein
MSNKKGNPLPLWWQNIAGIRADGKGANRASAGLTNKFSGF